MQAVRFLLSVDKKMIAKNEDGIFEIIVIYILGINIRKRRHPSLVDGRDSGFHVAHVAGRVRVPDGRYVLRSMYVRCFSYVSQRGCCTYLLVRTHYAVRTCHLPAR